MKRIDVFNGDADGICSLLQLRQTTPCESTLVTGIKREINLLDKLNAEQGDVITVLDISLDKNRESLLRNLNKGAQFFYVDHHFCGEIPQNDKLTTLIDTAPNICTSLLIHQHLASLDHKNAHDTKHHLWAITGAFGDNLNASAQTLASQHQLMVHEIDALKSLGIYLNYNGYGADLNDLHFTPDVLYQKLLPYPTPFDFIHDPNSVYQQLKSGYDEDNANASAISSEFQSENTALFILPDAAWARRISGVYSNYLANQFPDRAHAVLTHNAKNGYLISVRAPINNKTGADTLCRLFASGGGRKAAAGINHLPKNELSLFIDEFQKQYGK